MVQTVEPTRCRVEDGTWDPRVRPAWRSDGFAEWKESVWVWKLRLQSRARKLVSRYWMAESSQIFSEIARSTKTLSETFIREKWRKCCLACRRHLWILVSRKQPSYTYRICR